MDLTKRQIKMNELATALTAQMKRCDQAGIDPLDDPSVQTILAEIDSNTPDEINRLQEQQQEVQDQILPYIEKSWCSPEKGVTKDQVLQVFFELCKQMEDDDTKLHMITQDPMLKSLMEKYREIGNQMVERMVEIDRAELEAENGNL